MNDLLFVSFNKDECRNETGICIGRKNKDESHSILKMALDKEADYLYALLTNQEEKAIPISVIEQIKKEILNKENYSSGSELYMNGELIDADISVGVVLEIIDKHIMEYKL